MLLVCLLPAVDSFDAQSSKPFNSVAVAGRNIPGGTYCDCGDVGCVCEPGELPGGGQGLTVQSSPAPEPKPVNASGGLLVNVLIVALVLRMRWLL